MVLRQAGAIGSISSAYGPARYDVVTQKCKNPTEMNPVGFLVLATSYSRTACRRTTIGAAAFHFRVRNGNGWGHCANVTRVRNRTGGFAAVAATQARGRISRDDIELSKERQFLWHLHTGVHFG